MTLRPGAVKSQALLIWVYLTVKSISVNCKISSFQLVRPRLDYLSPNNGFVLSK